MHDGGQTREERHLQRIGITVPGDVDEVLDVPVPRGLDEAQVLGSHDEDEGEPEQDAGTDPRSAHQDGVVGRGDGLDG